MELHYIPCYYSIKLLRGKVNKMGTEGAFEFTNGTSINVKINAERITDVLEHEITHNVLYTQTTYGQFVLMLEKNALLFPQAQILQDTLFSSMNRMQEKVAVNTELLNVLKRDGMESYTDAINRLKERNNNYYNYFRKLCCINGKAKSVEDAEELITIIVNLAIVALNVNLALIPFENMHSSKEYARFMTQENNSRLYLPNRRFDILVNFFFRNNENDNDIDSVLKGTINIEKFDDILYIHNIAYEKAKSVFAISPIADRLIKRLESIGVKAASFEEMKYLGVRPKRLEEKNNIKFNLIDSEDEFKEKIKEDNIREIMVMHSMSGFEDFFVLNLHEKRGNEKYIFCLGIWGEENFFRLISKLECTFIFDKLKLISKEGNSIRKMVRMLPIYIYIDVPIGNIIEQIENYFYSAKYSFYEEKGYIVLVISKRSHILLADIIVEAKSYLNNRFLSKKMEYVEDISQFCNIDEIKRIHTKCLEYEVIDKNDMNISKNKITDYPKSRQAAINALLLQ